MSKLFAKILPKIILETCNFIHESGGKAWLVGGCVRDTLLGLQPKDWDIEVYQLSEEDLKQVLKGLGHYEHVGKHFGVFKLWVDGFEIDVALPRKEKKAGLGHKAFDIKSDPSLLPEQAVLRRDFTINAMMYNPLSHTLLDFRGGKEDLNHKILSHVSPAFVEDPLRPLRAMQFAARFNLTLTSETAELCNNLRVESGTLASSRIWQEWLKWSMSDYPSMGLKALKDMSWDSLYPDLVAMQGCPQDVYWHPEGDVWVHTCLVVDEAARLAKERQFSERDRMILVFAALCHDLGKPSTTVTHNDGKVISPNHGQAGVEPSVRFLQAIGAPKWLMQQVKPLVKEHVAHFSGDVTPRAVKRLAKRLLPSNIQMWESLTEADACGRSPAPKSRPALAWLALAQELEVVKQEMPAIITGKLLISWGMQPSSEMGKVLEQAYEAQLDEIFVDEESAKHWFKKYHIARISREA